MPNISTQIPDIERDFFTRVYANMLRTSTKRGHLPPTFTKLEFKDYYSNDPTFLELFKHWKSSDYVLEMRPTFDRLNDDERYSFGNIELKSWKDNHHKQTMKKSKLVCQIASDYTSIYRSVSHAALITGTHKGALYNALNRGCKANKCLWMYYFDWIKLQCT